MDRSFVLGMAEDADDAAIVRSTIELAKALGLRVVAEGVEDERTWRMLHAAGCDAAQGWFYARPMPAEELVGWLARYRPVRPAPPPTPSPPDAAGPEPRRWRRAPRETESGHNRLAPVTVASRSRPRGRTPGPTRSYRHERGQRWPPSPVRRSRTWRDCPG